MALLRLALAVFLIQNSLPQENLNGSIHGVVLNAITGTRLAGAAVELIGTEHGRVVSRSTKSDGAGEFNFADLPPGFGYQLIVSGEDLQSTAHGQNSWDDPWVPIRVEPGQSVNNIQISVNPLTSIRGTVRNDKGEAISNARVVALRRAYAQNQPVLEETGFTISSPTGFFSLSGLSPGIYYVRVMPVNREDSTADTLLKTPSLFDRPSNTSRLFLKNDPKGYPMTYFPGTPDLESAEAIHLRSGGAATNIDVVVSEVVTGRLTGSVQSTEQPASSGNVILQRQGASMESSWTRTAEIRQGVFDIRGVLPGSYVLRARTGEAPDLQWGRVALEVSPGNNTRIDIQVSPASNISGRIRVEGRPETNLVDPGLYSVSLSAATSWADTGLPFTRLSIAATNAIPDSEGRFLFRNVPPLDYRVLVTLEDKDSGQVPAALRDLYTKTIRVADRDVSEEGLEVTVPFDDVVDILLASDSGGLNGRVHNEIGENAGGATIVLIPDLRRRWDRYKATTASNTGRFQFQGLMPGSYKLFAWNLPSPGAWYDPEFIRDFEDRGTPIHIAPGVADYVELQLLR